MNKDIKNKVVNNVKNKLKNYNKLQEDINDINSALDLLLKEDLSFVDNNQQQQRPMPPTAPEQPQPVQQMPEEMDAQENNQTSPKIDTMINKMREIALDGIRELAHNSTSDAYVFFKKVWDMADKAQEAKKEASQKIPTN